MLLVIVFGGFQSIAEKTNSFSNHPFTSEHKVSPYLRLNEVKARAVRHFKKHFSFCMDEKWMLDNECYVASFLEGNIRTRVYYHKDGYFICCVKSYTKDEMSSDLRERILSKFRGCEIIVVTEFSNLDKQVYYIKINDGATVKTLSCIDSDIEITESYINGGK